MADFNTQTEGQIITDLTAYGYEHIETTNPTAPLIMYFKDLNDSILKLIVDTTTQAMAYGYDPDNCHRNQSEILALSNAADLLALDALLIPEYVYVDPVLFKTENLTEIADRNVLVPTAVLYYTAEIFNELPSFTPHNISVSPSPYRKREMIWVPVTFNSPNWELTYNSSVIVNTADVVTNEYGDFIVVLPEE